MTYNVFGGTLNPAQFNYLEHSQRVLGGLCHCAKFGCTRCGSFDNMNVSIFGMFGWKTPIHARQIKSN